MNSPGSTDLVMPVLRRRRRRPFPMRRWPATPTCPASTTSSSTTVLPAMPTCAASSTRWPIADAVRDLDEVVDLRAGANARFADRRAIDRRVGADLHVVFDDDVGVLRNLEMRAVGLLGEAEAVAADDGAVLDDDAVADDDALANRHVRVHDAVVADPRAGADGDVRIDDRPRADRRARADGDERADRHVRADRGVARDGAQRVDARRRRLGAERGGRSRARTSCTDRRCEERARRRSGRIRRRALGENRGRRRRRAAEARNTSGWRRT